MELDPLQTTLDPVSGEPNCAESASDKAKAYLLKKKSELIDSVQAVFADQMPTYEAVRHANSRKFMAPNLNDGEPTMTTVDLGSFFSSADGRMAVNFLSCNYSAKRNVSFSFDVPGLLCRVCSDNPHAVMTSYNSTSEGPRSILILGDQSSPANLPGEEGTCIPVMRVESATLKEIVNQFLAVTRNFTMQPGSYIVLSSGTQLSTSGLESYLTDFREVSGWIHDRFRGEVELVPGPPFLMAGSTCPQLIRSCCELATWSNNSSGTANILANTWKTFADALLLCGNGEAQLPSNQLYMLPASLGGGTDKKLWTSQGWAGMPYRTVGLTAAAEKAILATMCQEISDKLGLQIGPLRSDRSKPDTTPASSGVKK